MINQVLAKGCFCGITKQKVWYGVLCNFLILQSIDFFQYSLFTSLGIFFPKDLDTLVYKTVCEISILILSGDDFMRAVFPVGKNF